MITFAGNQNKFKVLEDVQGIYTSPRYGKESAHHTWFKTLKQVPESYLLAGVLEKLKLLEGMKNTQLDLSTTLVSPCHI